MTRVSVSLLLVLAFGALTSGCGALSSFGGGIGKTGGSYAIDDESIELELHKDTGLKIMVDPLTAALAPVAIGFAVDTLKAELDKDADRYTAQYTGLKKFVADFWSVDNQGKFGCSYTGGTLTRKSGNTVTCKIKFVFAPLKTANLDDTPFLSVKLTSVELPRSKAKVGWPNKKVKIDLHFVQNAQWIDDKGALQQKDVATADWSGTVDVGGKLDLTSAPVEIGVLVAIPSRGDKSGEDAGKAVYKTAASLTKLSLQVTETDTSGAKQVVERLSKAVGDNRDDLVKALVSAAGVKEEKKDEEKKPDENKPDPNKPK